MWSVGDDEGWQSDDNRGFWYLKKSKCPVTKIKIIIDIVSVTKIGRISIFLLIYVTCLIVITILLYCHTSFYTILVIVNCHILLINQSIDNFKLPTVKIKTK